MQTRNKRTEIRNIKMMKIIAGTLIALFLLAGCNSKNKQNRTISWKEYKNISDSILNSVTVNDRNLFAEVGKEDYIQLNDINSFSKDYLSFINVIDDDDIKIYIEVPYSESGDWNNEYIYVFDKTGMLKLLI
jgi:hypothetical protein